MEKARVVSDTAQARRANIMSSSRKDKEAHAEKGELTPAEVVRAHELNETFSKTLLPCKERFLLEERGN